MRVGIGLGLAFVVLLLAMPPAGAAPAKADLAAAKGEGAHGKDEAHHGEELDLFKGGIELTIWSIVVFFILFLLLSRFAWPQIAEGLDKRERAIAHDKHEAVLAKREADKLRGELAAKMQEANDRIRDMMDKATRDAAAAAAEEISRGKAEVAAERERALRDVRREKDDALSEIWERGVTLATLISTKAVRKQLSEADHRALVGEALAEFRAAAQTRKENLESAHA